MCVLILILLLIGLGVFWIEARHRLRPASPLTPRAGGAHLHSPRELARSQPPSSAEAFGARRKHSAGRPRQLKPGVPTKSDPKAAKKRGWPEVGRPKNSHPGSDCSTSETVLPPVFGTCASNRRPHCGEVVWPVSKASGGLELCASVAALRKAITAQNSGGAVIGHHLF